MVSTFALAAATQADWLVLASCATIAGRTISLGVSGTFGGVLSATIPSCTLRSLGALSGKTGNMASICSLAVAIRALIILFGPFRYLNVGGTRRLSRAGRLRNGPPISSLS